MTNLELANYINDGLKTGYTISTELGEPESVVIECFVVCPGTHEYESILGSEKCDGYEVYLADDEGDSLVKTFFNIHGAFQYVFTELGVMRARQKVALFIQYNVKGGR